MPHVREQFSAVQEREFVGYYLWILHVSSPGGRWCDLFVLCPQQHSGCSPVSPMLMYRSKALFGVRSVCLRVRYVGDHGGKQNLQATLLRLLHCWLQPMMSPGDDDDSVKKCTADVNLLRIDEGMFCMKCLYISYYLRKQLSGRMVSLHSLTYHWNNSNKNIFLKHCLCFIQIK